jgi:hypothetical protein
MAEPDLVLMNVLFRAELAASWARANKDERWEHAREVRKEQGDW